MSFAKICDGVQRARAVNTFDACRNIVQLDGFFDSWWLLDGGALEIHSYGTTDDADRMWCVSTIAAFHRCRNVQVLFGTTSKGFPKRVLISMIRERERERERERK